MKTLPPCDHDECPPTRCIQTTNAKGVGFGDGLGCPPFKDRQKVSLERWDNHSPPWDRVGECIVVGQKQTRGCESGWMVTVMAKDGTYRELDSHWIQHPNAEPSQAANL